MILNCKRERYGGHFGRMKIVDVAKAVAEYIQASGSASNAGAVSSPDSNQCRICLDSMAVLDPPRPITKLDCGHQFHKEVIYHLIWSYSSMQRVARSNRLWISIVFGHVVWANKRLSPMPSSSNVLLWLPSLALNIYEYLKDGYALIFD